ncbi:MAG TPA: hypothetical protein VKU60_12145, partial [Chloroflexota bacterium]|nr:hypothetical protein [Chloroflexota bacterium]
MTGEMACWLLAALGQHLPANCLAVQECRQEGANGYASLLLTAHIGRQYDGACRLRQRGAAGL